MKLILASTFAAVIVATSGALAYGAQQPRISPARERVVDALDAGLAGTPMAHTGRELEAAGWKWKVHPAFIAGIAGTESSFGRLGCRGNPRNSFGLSSCNSGWRVPYFPTWAAAYDFMGRFLASRWPSARSPYDYHGYAACSSCWGRATSLHMSRFGLGTNVRYGR